MSKIIYRVQRQQNILWLRAAVRGSNNTPLLVKLLIDTGASYTVLPRKILQRIGCNLNQPLGNKKIVTANGVIVVPIVAVPSFNCLGVKQENYPVVALDLPANSFTEGLLGMDFLCEVKAVIDVARGEIRRESQ
ncbi:MAG: retropepsin-like aspartic protease [Xenococcaceae cyanobacterium MO_188.B32]|nr:retropepsin-like aspartic protease [Xenococcaceae cyanobacterium MO_188.B32]